MIREILDDLKNMNIRNILNDMKGNSFKKVIFRNRLAIGFSLVGLIAFIIITINVLNGNLDTFNEEVYYYIASLINPTLTLIVRGVSFFGTWIPFGIACVLFVLPKTRKRAGVPLLFSALFGAATVVILKIWIAVPRPDILPLVSAGGYGHPSGHVLRAVVFFSIAALLILDYSKTKTVRVSAILAMIILPLMIGFSRIYLGVHTATDIMASFSIGIVVIVLSAIMLQYTNFWSVNSQDQ